MFKRVGIPYMGSKRNISFDIVDYIAKNNPNCKYFYDLFGGGGSISFMALQFHQFKKVIYNELNTGVCELLKKINKDGITSEFYQWVDRETFHQNKDKDDWFGGLCKVIWSFGGAQRTYIFGEDIEQYKKWYHGVVINNIDYTKEMSDYCKNFVQKEYGIEQELILTMPVKQDFQDRRLEIRKQLVSFEKSCKLKQLRCIQQLQQLERLQQLQQLQQIQRLQQLQKIKNQNFNKLEIKNLSFDEVQIQTPPNETIIYLDPPYNEKAQYQVKLNYDVLLNWIEKSPYKIYVSSYEFKELNECLSLEHRCTLSQTSNNSVKEKLFCNKIENKKLPLLFF